MNERNIIFTLDAYKWDHESLYREGFEGSYAHQVFRNGSVFPYHVWFSLSAIVQRWLTTPITQKDVDEAKAVAAEAFGDVECFNWRSWQRIVDEFGGKLPIQIKALPEGTIVNTRVPLVTV